MSLKLSIIIPCYNEEKTIAEILRKVFAVKIPAGKEIIIVDDCSSDRTFEIASSFKSRFKNLKLLRHSKNQGKGSAIRTGIKHATGDFTIIQDADLEYNPEDYTELLKLALEKKASVVYGSRFKGSSKITFSLNLLANKFLTFATNLLYNSKLSDMETCFKLVQTRLLKSLNIKAEKFEFEPEITAKILKRRIRIFEVSITYNPRKRGEGKKIKWTDGVQALQTLLSLKFSKEE